MEGIKKQSANRQQSLGGYTQLTVALMKIYTGYMVSVPLFTWKQSFNRYNSSKVEGLQAARIRSYVLVLTLLPRHLCQNCAYSLNPDMA